MIQETTCKDTEKGNYRMERLQNELNGNTRNSRDCLDINGHNNTELHPMQT